MLGNERIVGGEKTNAAQDIIRAMPILHPADMTALTWVWESKASATIALRAAKAAVQSVVAKRPTPEWTKQAIAAGWKAPKGWKP